MSERETEEVDGLERETERVDVALRDKEEEGEKEIE